MLTELHCLASLLGTSDLQEEGKHVAVSSRLLRTVKTPLVSVGAHLRGPRISSFLVQDKRGDNFAFLTDKSRYNRHPDNL